MVSRLACQLWNYADDDKLLGVLGSDNRLNFSATLNALCDTNPKECISLDLVKHWLKMSFVG